MKRQEEDFQWFQDNLSDLYEKHGDCYVAISNKEVLGIYESYVDALNYTCCDHVLGTFIVQKIGPDESYYTNYVF